MVVVTEVKAEENIDERRAQFSHCDVRFARQVDRAEGLEKSLPRTGTRILRNCTRFPWSKDPCCSEDLATILRRAGMTWSPNLLCSSPAIKLVYQVIQKIACNGSGAQSADQGPLIEVDETYVGQVFRSFVVKTVIEVLCKRGLITKSRFDTRYPFKKAPVIYCEEVNKVLGGRTLLEFL